MSPRSNRGGLIDESQPVVEPTAVGGPTAGSTSQSPGSPPMGTGSGGHSTVLDRLLTGTSWTKQDLELAASLIVAGGIALDAVLTFALLAQA